MIKKILLAAAVLFVLTGAGLFVWARAILASDTVRVAVAAQLTKALGQPVTVGRISATVFPRVTMNLGDVAIGPAGRLTIQTLHVGTNFRALLSRRIEHGELRVSGMHADLPLPPLTIDAASTADRSSSGPSVQIVSIDAIVFQQVELVSGDRTLRADLDVAPQPSGAWTIRRATLGAADADIEITGEIADLAGPTADLTVKAKHIDIVEMLAFIADFSKGAGIASSSSAAAPAAAVPMNIVLNLQADRVMLGTLALEALKGRARVTPEAITLDPIAFGAFAGTYAGSLSLALADVPAFRLRGTLAGVDMAAAMAFLGMPDTMTGRLAGTVAVAGTGLAADNVRKTVRGQARVEVTNGTVKGLGLVRSVVLATSMRSDAAVTTDAAASERFSRLEATLALADGFARTDDLQFTSTDVLFAAAGTMRLDGTAVDLAGKVQLSDELSKQAGRDLVRYTQEGGRVTLPATVSGPADNLAVRIDVAGAAERAILNRAREEFGKAIKRKLGGLFGR